MTGFAIREAGFGVWTEFAIVVAVTAAGCVLGFEVFRRIPVLRLVMGMKALAPVVGASPVSGAGKPETLQKV